MSEIEILNNLTKNGLITRRDFIGKLTALGALSVCGSIIKPASLKAATPQKGGRFRLGVTGGAISDSLDPAVIEDVMPFNINWQLRNCLVEIDHTGNLIPELAESWESTPDAKKWIFNIRSGVEFHNGKTLDAQDVIDSINYHRGEKSKSRAKSIVDPIEDIASDGKNRVVFTLQGGNADFPYIMSDFHLSILPAGDTNFNAGIGTGGYVLEKFEPGVRCLVKRNPNYWKTGRAHFDEVETIAITDINARTSALKTGRIDVMNRCDLKTVHLLERASKLKVIKYDGTKHYTFPMRTDVAPYDNNDVRLALKHAIDRKQIVKTILRGYGSLGNDHPIASMNRYHAGQLPQREYDPDKSKYYMKKAGLGQHKFKLHVADAAFPGAVDAGVLYQEHAAKAGIDIEVVRVPNDGYWKETWKKVGWCACYWTSRPTEDWMFSMAYAEDAKQNDTKWRHPKFNQLLIAARAELDESKRRQMYVEMQSLVRDEGGVVVPMFANNIEAISSKIMHGKLAGNWELDGERCAERWWFAS
jgi:peptide/nickel transport system substrate-binding protein